MYSLCLYLLLFCHGRMICKNAADIKGYYDNRFNYWCNTINYKYYCHPVHL